MYQDAGGLRAILVLLLDTSIVMATVHPFSEGCFWQDNRVTKVKSCQSGFWNITISSLWPPQPAGLGGETGRAADKSASV